MRGPDQPSMSLLLDLWDWLHVFGTDPVIPDAWCLRFRPTALPASGRRNWLRITKHLLLWGVPHERIELVMPHPEVAGSTTVLAIRLEPEAREWAAEWLDYFDEVARRKAAMKAEKERRRVEAREQARQERREARELDRERRAYLARRGAS